ncbi:hypothetical protein RFI_14884, partial [Reticulomyxa filosa]
NLLFFQWVIMFRKIIMKEFVCDKTEIGSPYDDLFEIDLSHLTALQDEIMDMLSGKKENMHVIASHLVKTFLVTSTELEINVSFSCKEEIKARVASMQHVDSVAEYCKLFIEPVNECYQLMQALYVSSFS